MKVAVGCESTVVVVVVMVVVVTVVVGAGIDRQEHAEETTADGVYLLKQEGFGLVGLAVARSSNSAFASRLALFFDEGGAPQPTSAVVIVTAASAVVVVAVLVEVTVLSRISTSTLVPHIVSERVDAVPRL